MDKVFEPVSSQFLRNGRQLDDGSFLTAIRCLGALVPIVLPHSSWIPELVPHLPPESKPDVATEVADNAIRFREIFEDADEDSEEVAQGGAHA